LFNAGLLSERQRVARNVRRVKVQAPKSPSFNGRKTPGPPTTPGPTTRNPAGPPTPTPAKLPSTPGALSTTAACAAIYPDCRPLERLSEEHRNLVTHLVTCQEHYEIPRPEDIAHVAVC